MSHKEFDYETLKDGTFKQGQAFVASAQQLQSSTVAQAVANAKQLAAKVAAGNLPNQGFYIYFLNGYNEKNYSSKCVCHATTRWDTW